MITSTTNPRIKQIRELQRRRRARVRDGLFVVEGLRWAGEILRANAAVQVVVHTDGLDARGRGIVNNLAGRGAEVLSVSDAVMASLSDVQTPQGVLAVVNVPQLNLPEPLTLAVVADRLRDPGNLGTLLRTALAAGVEAVFLTPGTVDAYNPKVVRGAAGAHVRLPIATIPIETLEDRLAGLDVWLAEAGQGERYDRVDWRRPAAVIIGGEAAGARPELAEEATGTVHIPLAGETESLNAAVAAAVILFEIRRQRRPE